jgi:hypothetical protein
MAIRSASTLMKLKLEHPGWQPHNLQSEAAERTREASLDEFVFH